LIQYPAMTASELRQRRTELGYSIRVLAEVLGVDSAQLQAWECGDEVIPETAYLEIAFRALTNTRRSEWPSLLRDDNTFRV
jgi:transcriptional regulator with XRE-family HTH domain